MWSVSLMCDEQERNALYSWLYKNDYRSHQYKCQDTITEFYINCEAKVFSMVGFVGYDDPKPRFSTKDNHVLCKGLTQTIGVIQTLNSMPKYYVTASVDFMLEHAPEVVEKLSNAYATMAQDIPVEITAETKIDSKTMKHTGFNYNDLYMSPEAMKDMMEWSGCGATYETITPKEFWDLPVKECVIMSRRMSDERFEEMLDYPLTAKDLEAIPF